MPQIEMQFWVLVSIVSHLGSGGANNTFVLMTFFLGFDLIWSDIEHDLLFNDGHIIEMY